MYTTKLSHFVVKDYTDFITIYTPILFLLKLTSVFYNKGKISARPKPESLFAREAVDHGGVKSRSEWNISSDLQEQYQPVKLLNYIVRKFIRLIIYFQEWSLIAQN